MPDAHPRVTDRSPIESVLDRAAGLVVVRGLPGSGRSQLVRDWIDRSAGRGVEWVRTTVPSTDNISSPGRGGVIVLEGVVGPLSQKSLDGIGGWLSDGVDVVLVPSGPFPLTGLPLQRTVISQPDLAWDESRTRACFETRSISASDEVVTAINRHTGGWAALITAAAEAWPLGSTVTDPAPGLRAAAISLTADLAGVLGATPEHDLLQALTIETTVAPAMLTQLLARPVGPALQELQTLGLVRHLPDSGQVELVPLLREVLYAAATDEDHTAQLELHQAAGAWNLEAGLVVAALEHQLAANDWDAIGPTLDRGAVDLLLDPRSQLAVTAINGLLQRGANLSNGARHLAEYFGLVPAGTTPVEWSLRAASARATASTPTDEQFLGHLLVMVLTQRQAFHGAAAASLSAALIDLVERNRPQGNGPADSIAPLCFLHHGISQANICDFLGARAFLERAWDLRSRDAYGFVGVAAAAALAALQAVIGETAQSRTWLSRAETEPPPPEHLAAWAYAPLSIARQVLAGDVMDFEEAASYLDVGFEPYDELWPFRLWVQFRDRIQRQEVASAVALVEVIERRFPAVAHGDGLHTSGVSGVQALVLLMAGHATRAQAHAERSQDLIIGVNALARVRLASGDAEGCYQLSVAGVGRFSYSPRSVLSLQTTAAAAAFATGQLVEAGERLEDAIGIARRHQMVGLMIDVPRSLLEAYADRPVVADLLRILDSTDWIPAFPAQAKVVVLTERELVVLRELAAGHSVEQVARRLVVSVNTIKSQSRTLYRKLGARTRDEATAEAGRLGLLIDEH